MITRSDLETRALQLGISNSQLTATVRCAVWLNIIRENANATLTVYEAEIAAAATALAADFAPPP